MYRTRHTGSVLPNVAPRNGTWFCLLLAIGSMLPLPAWAQRPRIEAIAGRPFGVGRIVLPVEMEAGTQQLRTHLMTVTSAEDRVHYPAIRYTQPLGLVMDVLGINRDRQRVNELHIHFLFTGAEPFDVQLSLPTPMTLRVAPRNRRAGYQRLLRAWWVRYKSSTQRPGFETDYSPVVETYLTSMLAQRLQLPKPSPQVFSDDGRSLSMLLGTEKIHLAMLSEAVEGRYLRQEPLDTPLPAQMDWPKPPRHDEPREEVEIEPIALHVPEECFYVRFSQFQNYIWLRRLLEEYGGDLSRMVMLRGTDPQLNQRLENQLGLRESSLSQMLGPQVISDVAMIGRDTYLAEGAAVGILFEAKNELLRPELQQQRQRRLDALKRDGATEETLVLAGQDVSFMSTPDNRMRSFYAQSGNYHLVTNCQQIARRFLECALGQGSLGQADEFRHARSMMPQADDHTLQVYLSRRFFEGLLTPQYQIELPRRLRALADLQAEELARLVAAAEGHSPSDLSVDQLVERGFLQAPVDHRVDGSQNAVTGQGPSRDSLRGARGTFLPIPDVRITQVTRTEAARFQKTAQFHQDRWRQMDPVAIAIRRRQLDGSTERVQIQAHMLPLNKEKYGLLTEVFGAPTTQIIKPRPDDIVSVQAFVDGGAWPVRPHHLYFGICDAAPNNEYSDRPLLKSLQVMRTAPAYFASWPVPGILDALGLVGNPTEDGFRKLLLGLYRFDDTNEFSFLSFDKQIIREVAPEMVLGTASEPAQLRVQVGNIKESRFGQWADDLDFQRAWETSVGNIRLMHLLTQQLRIPPAEAEATVERLLNAKLICPLGGEYRVVDNSDGTQRWISSAWQDGKPAARKRYVSPLMNWLRGLSMRLTIEDDRIVAFGTLDIEREKRPGFQLPGFNLFGEKK